MNLVWSDAGSLLNSIMELIRQHFIDLVLAFVIILGCLLLQRASISILKSISRRMDHGSGESGRNRILLALQRPLSVFVMLAGCYAAINLFPISLTAEAVALTIFRSLAAILILWWLYNLTSNQEGYVKYLVEERFKVDPALSPVVLNILKVFIVICGTVLIASEWGYDLNAFVAGLGLGGLALALAAKDTLANLFGGVIILTEKPFRIGDWVQTKSVDGVVEEIGFRSCRFRTFTQALVTVPNYALTNDAITNWSRIGKRRIDFHLPLSFSTPTESLRAVVQEIKEMLEAHEGIHPETIMVYFERFGAASLDVFVYCFTLATARDEHLAVKEDINYQILNILDEAHVTFNDAVREA